MTRVRTANDRFKSGEGVRQANGLTLAVLFFFSVFAWWPDMSSASMETVSDELSMVAIPDEIVIPPPPQQIARPATPVVSAAVMDDEITIAPTTFEANTLDNLPPPAKSARDSVELSRTPTFTPYTVGPDLLNRREVESALVRNYPPMLRDAGISGAPVLHFFIDEEGKVLKTLISESSGYDQLDEAAIEVGKMMRFSPALNGSQKVPVWVELPVRFIAK